MQTRICSLIERRAIRIETMELKSPDDNEVVIQMGAGGICGSDLALLQGWWLWIHPSPRAYYFRA